jgi:hypothetical protein
VARRTVWLVTGVVAGAAGSLYTERQLRRTLEAASARLQPDALVTEVGRTARAAARGTTGRVREAVAVGRSEKQRREQELWQELGSSGTCAGADGGTAGDGLPADASPGAAGEGAAVSPATGHTARGRGRRRPRRSASHLGN